MIPHRTVPDHPLGSQQPADQPMATPIEDAAVTKQQAQVVEFIVKPEKTSGWQSSGPSGMLVDPLVKHPAEALRLAIDAPSEASSIEAGPPITRSGVALSHRTCQVLNRTYYICKPLLPWALRVKLRRWRADYQRSTYDGVWPIDEKAGSVPLGWPGWPERKRFALVLTHDVEGSKGFARVGQLMNLESKQGFRSSFNFVPEGSYRVPETLRQTLDRAGFEVGIHGLKHDGKLYSSHAEFSRSATRIREYRRKWQAAGFRSPFMHHNLEWIHELGMEYDASTFDTDPFEPQPDGVGTVFPFWVPGPPGAGYVELPYTLAQDFTLFVILREPNIDIWKRKLDWVAERGGMALVNTHPDYMCFGETKTARDEFPAYYYEELLSYIRQRYEGVFWSALPRDVARFYRAAVVTEPRSSVDCVIAPKIPEVVQRFVSGASSSPPS
ncbi:MAG TPA: hypothetical protein VNO32_50175 [Candidatus Acidoferrum sp.]|nr:hypothetical protein [Candidatus Acidoferrum sp.]